MKSLLDLILITICFVLLVTWLYQGIRLYLVYLKEPPPVKTHLHTIHFHQKERKIIWLAPVTRMLSDDPVHAHRQSHTTGIHSLEPQLKHQNREHADLIRK
jgi:hypothetical protein